MLAQYVNGNPICYHIWFSKIVHVCFDLSESPDPVVKILQTELAWSRGRWVCDNFSVYSLVLFFFPSFVIFLQFCCIQSISIIAKTVLIPDLDAWGYPDRTSTRHELLRHSSDIWRPPGHELSRRIGITKGDFMALEKIWKHPSLNIPKKFTFTKHWWSPSCSGVCVVNVFLRSNVAVLIASKPSVCAKSLVYPLLIFPGCPTWQFFKEQNARPPQICCYSVKSLLQGRPTTTPFKWLHLSLELGNLLPINM